MFFFPESGFLALALAPGLPWVMRPSLALLVLVAVTGTACIPNLARYPEPGEPGPVITADGERIPEGPDRDAFMAGYHAGYERADAAVTANRWPKRTGAIGGLVTGATVPLTLLGWVPGIPFALGGIGLVVLAKRVGPDPTLSEVPDSVAGRGVRYEEGYREGYARGVRLDRERWTAGGVMAGILVFLYVFLNHS